MKNSNLILVMTFILFLGVSCKKTKKDDAKKEKCTKVKNELKSNTLCEDEKKEGFVLLFDGKTSHGWRGYKKKHFPAAWKIVDGTIHIQGSGRGEAGAKDGGDIVYDKVFQNFHLKLEWKVAKGGNSGIFYLGQETLDYIWKTAPEMQVLDNEFHPDAKLGIKGNRQAGALYDLIPANPQNFKGHGKWNRAEVICYKGTVIHKQNGEKVVEYHLWTPDWKKMVKNSKFPKLNRDWHDVAAKGFIGLQDHGDDVWFRNIRIKEMD